MGFGWCVEFNAGIDFLEFRPSEVAAAVAISVASETKTVDTEKPIPLLFQLHLEKVQSLITGTGPTILSPLSFFFFLTFLQVPSFGL